MNGQFPEVALASDELVTGTVDVVTATELHGVGAQRADVFLVREGQVVTLPVAQDSVGVQWDLCRRRDPDAARRGRPGRLRPDRGPRRRRPGRRSVTG
jgi:hypothetical protein